MLIESALAEIGESLGLPLLEFNANNVAALQLGEMNTVHFERLGSAVLVSLSRPLPQHGAAPALRAMELAGAEAGAPFPVRPGLTRDRRLVLSVRFAERDFILSSVTRALTLLKEMHKRIAA